MVLKTEKEARLLSASKQFDKGLSTYNLGLWDSILSHDVILHKDAITLNEDLYGAGAVKAYYQVRPSWPAMRCLSRTRSSTSFDRGACWRQAYIDRYEYEHVTLAGAADPHDNVTFSLSVDKVSTLAILALPSITETICPYYILNSHVPLCRASCRSTATT